MVKDLYNRIFAIKIGRAQNLPEFFNRQIYIIILIFSPLSSISQLLDTTDLFNFTIDEMLQVEVVSNVVSDLSQSPVSVTTISAFQLETSGARTLADAIQQYVPGFFIVEDQDDVIAAFRGLAPDNNSKVMLLVNGVKLNTEWFWGPPSAILNSTDYSYIKSVEVIRGPGSVTLGQGALLGVINIITKAEDKNCESLVSVSMGDNGYLTKMANAHYNSKEMAGFVHMALNEYNGQKFRNEGYGKIAFEGDKGGLLSQSGARIKKSTDNALIGNLKYKGLTYNFMYFDQKKDLYNFRRDRNVMQEKIAQTGIKYDYRFSKDISTKTELIACFDDFSLFSTQGYTMGGTRENRYSANTILNINQPKISNKIAIGAEFLSFDFGNQNQSGNNFINNIADSIVINNPEAYIDQANTQKKWAYNGKVQVFSLFAEDFYTIGDLNLFAAFRYDNHSHWGSNVSPRVGLIYSPFEKLKIRLSYQTGFRGAVGLHYAGGYRQDGLLSAKNFNIISDAHIPVVDSAGVPTGRFYTNIPELKPEIMQSAELAVFWRPDYDLRFEITGFYNCISNVIDVGVFWADTNYYKFQSLGTDLPGDWNGYWFFKNNEGKVKYAGSEASVNYSIGMFSSIISHSWVSVLKADAQQKGSMYITSKNEIKAYPANVTRFGWTIKFSNKIWVGNNWIYYYQWVSPGNQTIKANLTGNISFTAKLSDQLKINFNVINILGNNRLYPMNSNSGDPRIADGTPSQEQTSFWVSLTYVFD